MNLKSTTTKGFNFRIINSLFMASWGWGGGVPFTWLDCKERTSQCCSRSWFFLKVQLQKKGNRYSFVILISNSGKSQEGFLFSLSYQVSGKKRPSENRTTSFFSTKVFIAYKIIFYSMVSCVRKYLGTYNISLARSL